MADTSFVKTEPEETKPEVVDDEDLYEDAGDLEFYDNTNAHNESLYLARVPRYMWDAWLKLAERAGDNDEIQIGTLRTWKEPAPGGEGHVKDKLRMLLHPGCPEHQVLPREYDLEILASDVNNHFIFSEEDLPGFKARNKARAEAASAGIPSSLLRPKPGAGVEKPTYDRRSRFQPYYRKAIPSE